MTQTPSDDLDDRDKPNPDWTRPPEPALHRAARKGDTARIAQLLAEGADIEERAEVEFGGRAYLSGLTALMIAARSVDGATADTLRFLVERGADVHARSCASVSAAWYAAGLGGRWWVPPNAITPDHVERLRYLLDQGLDPNESSHAPLLAQACEAGDPSRVELLLQRGAVARVECDCDDPEARPPSFRMPICCAARSGSVHCVRLVLEMGVDPDSRDRYGETALMMAGSPDVVRTLLAAGSNRDAVNERGKDAVACILWGHPLAVTPLAHRYEAVKALIEAGADIERQDECGMTRLAAAAFDQNPDAVEFLLALGARADARSPEGATPLHGICWWGERDCADEMEACERIIRALVKAGCPVDAADHDGVTALHQAARGDWSNPTAIRVLLELGATVDVPDSGGCTPLMLAAARGELPSIEALCAAGADPTRLNAAGETALDAARWFLSLFDVGHALRPNAEAALACLERAAAKTRPTGLG